MNRILLAALLLFAVGCKEPTEPPRIAAEFLPQTSPEDVLHNLVLAYNLRDVNAYAALLAKDFVFEFGPQDPSSGIPPSRFWHMEEDSLSSRNMFKVVNSTAIGRTTEKSGSKSLEDHGPTLPVRPATWGGIKAMYRQEPIGDEQGVLEVSLRLTFGPSIPVNEPGHEGERTITAVTRLVVEQQGSSEEGTITLVVDEDRAEFYFRKGATPEDSSSNFWYIVRWKDRPKRTL